MSSDDSVEVFGKNSEIVDLLSSYRVSDPARDDVRRDAVSNPVVFAAGAQVLDQFRPFFQTGVKQYPTKPRVDAFPPVLPDQERLRRRKRVEMSLQLRSENGNDRDDAIRVLFAVTFRFARMDFQTSRSEVDRIPRQRHRLLLPQARVTP